MAEIANRMKDMNKAEKTAYLKTLTAENVLKYQRFRNNERQKAYKQDPAKKALANERSRLNMFVNREKNPEKYKELNKKHNQDYYKRNQEKKKLSKEDAVRIIQKQYRKKKEAESIVKDILSDIIDTAPNMKIVTGELKKKRGRKIK